MDLFVDPLVYVPPDAEADYDARAAYVKHLRLWFEEWRLSNHEFFTSEICIYSLYEHGLYPLPDDLAQLWMHAGETFLSHRAVADILAQLLANTPQLEDRYPDLRDIEVYEKELRVRPDLVERNTSEVRPALRDSLGRVAYAKTAENNSPAKDLMFLTYPTSTEVAQIEGRAETHLETVDISADLPLATEPRDLDVRLELSAIWEDTPHALEWMLEDLIREGALEVGLQLSSYRIGINFNDMLVSQSIHNRSSVLYQVFRKCVLLLCGKYPPDKRTHHWLHKNKQIVVDGWGAWRMHITGSPLAYRLHYWRKGNEYRLMQIVPHENLKIDSPYHVD